MSDPTSRRGLPIVLLVLFFDLVGFSIVFPMLAELLAFYGRETGGAFAWLDAGLARLSGGGSPARHAAFFGGVLAGVYSLLQFAIIPWWGRLSDRHGRRPVLIASVVLNLAGYLIWMFSGSFLLFILSRVVTGLGSGNISVASAAVADLSTESNRARSMGLMGAAIGLGFITGPALGSTWAWMPHFGDVPTGGFALNPFSFPACLAAVLTLLNLALLVYRFPETLPPERRGRDAIARSADPRQLFSARLGSRVRRMNAAYLLFMLGFAGFEGTLVFLATDVLDWGPGRVGGCMVWLGLLSALIQGGVVRRFVARVGEKRLALFGLALMVPGYALIALVPVRSAAWLLWIGVSLLAVGVGFLSPTLAALVSLTAPPESQGRTMGAYRSVGALGRAIGPMVAAILYFRFGPGAPYAVGAVLSVFPVLLLANMAARAPAAVSAD